MAGDASVDPTQPSRLATWRPQLKYSTQSMLSLDLYRWCTTYAGYFPNPFISVKIHAYCELQCQVLPRAVTLEGRQCTLTFRCDSYHYESNVSTPAPSSILASLLDREPLMKRRVELTFRKAFPEIKSLAIVIEEESGGRPVHTHKFREGTFPGEHVHCRNPRCRNGGYAVGQALRYVTAKRATHLEESRRCQGHEGSPEGTPSERPCRHSFNTVIDVEFHSNN